MDEILEKSLHEDIDTAYNNMYQYYGITSFEQLDAIGDASTMTDDMMKLTYIVTMMLRQNTYAFGPTNDNTETIRSIRGLISEYEKRMEALMAEYENTASDEQKSLVTKTRDFVNGLIDKAKRKKVQSEESLTKEKQESEEPGLMIWKDSDGTYRWIALYSNNYKDDDDDIISKDSHERFVDLVDKGKEEMPELWHWHTPGSQWGKADMVSFDKETGIAIAAGTILKGHEIEAESFMNRKEKIGVSHGMPRNKVKFDESDTSNGRVIVEHVTKEISDLPLDKAANHLTSFEIIKEDDMGIPTIKKEYLKRCGLTDEKISKIEESMVSKAKQAEDEQLISKEVTGTTDVTDAAVEKQVASTETEVVENKTPVEGNEKPVEKEVTPTYATVNDVAEVFAKALSQINARFDEISGKINDVDGRVTKIDSVVKESIEKELELTPAMSLSGAIARKMSAIGSQEAIVTKNQVLAKSGPIEKERESGEELNICADPLLNKTLNNIIGSK